ncbi:hypothetical protein VB716_13500 [Synechococcus sp. CCY9201]|uniref:hypothetical protein n=1 Tax=Synechococcus sp. CCY9201 TaxID=174697 RepID=UPI002B2068A3|nr:hypothetical protein [Synechococcus sp. CCY9201]MEA5475234.1 hypothetical protein [Synechococcus sp. CCY9201]
MQTLLRVVPSATIQAHVGQDPGLSALLESLEPSTEDFEPDLDLDWDLDLDLDLDLDWEESPPPRNPFLVALEVRAAMLREALLQQACLPRGQVTSPEIVSMDDVREELSSIGVLLAHFQTMDPA